MADPDLTGYDAYLAGLNVRLAFKQMLVNQPTAPSSVLDDCEASCAKEDELGDEDID
jgi:hypothetical protein